MSNERSRKDQPPLAGEGGQIDFDQPQCITNGAPIDRVLRALQDHGCTVNRSGKGWMCTCPAHSDQNPSLSIDVGVDDRALLHCHAGCSAQSIVSTLGIPMKALFTSDSSTRKQPIKRHRVTVTEQTGSRDESAKPIGYPTSADAIHALTKKHGTPDHSWEYNDANGDPIGIVLRWDRESGKSIRPISLIEGRWHIRGMPVPRLLYRRNELLRSTDPVLICEGEKACEAARDCGFIATTSAHGSKASQKTDWTPIAGREVILVPDLDEAGEQYAQRVQQLCVDAGALSIRKIDLRKHWPQLGTGDDIADALDIENGDPQAVREGVEQLIELTEPEPTTHTRHEPKSKMRSDDSYRPFPIEVLPEPLYDFCREGAQAIGCDAAYIALPMLSMLAGAIGNSSKIEIKNSWHEPCNIWSCIVGSSGTAKSPAIELAIKPLLEIQERNLLTHKLALRDRSQKSVDEIEAPKLARQIIDDATIEAALQLLEENERGLLLRTDELSGWFDFDRYQSGKGSSNASRWIETFHGRSICVDRRTKDPIFVRSASLSITGSIQPGILRRVLSTRNLENGLAARFLFALPPDRPKVWSDQDLCNSTYGAMRTIVERLVALPMRTISDEPAPNILRFNQSARMLFIRFVNDLNASMELEEEHIRAAFSKLECYVPRFALIMHLVRIAADDKDVSAHTEIDAKSTAIAIRLAEWFAHETRRVYAMLSCCQRDQNQQDLISWIMNNGGCATTRELSRGPARYKGPGKAKNALDELKNAGHGFWHARKPNGRTMEFVLHEQSQSGSGPIDTSDSDTSAADMCRNAGIVTGASGQYPVLSTRKDN